MSAQRRLTRRRGLRAGRDILLGVLSLGATTRSSLAQGARPAKPSPSLATLAVFGDSLGDALWGALFRRFYSTTDIKVYRGSLSATGFNRTPYEDIFVQAISTETMNAAIMFTGANDAQDAFPLEQGAPPGAFGSEAWRVLYGRRLRRFHEAVKKAGVPLVWVGLPPMRDAWFEVRMAKVRAEQAALCEEFDVPYVSLASLAAGKGGSAAAPGAATVSLYYEDGIHLTAAANERIADLVLCQLLTGGYGFVSDDVEARLRQGLRGSCA